MVDSNLEARFKDYNFRIDWTSSEPFDPESEMIDVVLTTQDGQDYWANFTTLKFLEYMFEKNKRTGELLSGTYFCMPDNMVIVERLTEDKIKATIDALIEDYEIEAYFKIVDEEDPEKDRGYFIGRLKELRRRYDSKELDAETTFIELAKLDEEFEKSDYYDNEGFAGRFYDIHGDLYNECSREVESDGRMEKMAKQLEMEGRIISPRACIKRLEDLKQRYESGQLTEQQAGIELKRIYQDFKAVEGGPDKRGLNEFCDLYLDLESMYNGEIEPEETQEDFAAKLWVLRIDEIESKARDEIKSIGDEEILLLYRQNCNDSYFGSKRKYDFLRRQLKANPNKEFAAIKHLFEEYCQQLEVLEQVKKRKLS